LSPHRLLTVAGGLFLAAALTLSTGGCSYDYLQHTDRVAYRAGDAVKANLESETINPRKRSKYVTWGLGANGDVLSPSAATTSSAGGTGAPATAPSGTTAPPLN
jgi:hypothetical protein